MAERLKIETTSEEKAKKPQSLFSKLHFLQEVLAFISRLTPRHAPKQEQTASVYKIPEIQLPEAPKGVIPAHAETMANDASIMSSFEYANAAVWNGYGFMGYALLSDLAQVPEYRKPSEIIANEMTREWIKFVSTSEEEDKTDKIKQIEDEFERLAARELFRKAFENDNFFGVGHLYLDFGDISSEELRQELIPKLKVDKNRKLRSLKLIEPIWMYPNLYDSVDPLSDWFYKPKTWFAMSREIHSTRLLTFISRPVKDLLKPAYMFGGVSLTQLLYPYVCNWLRTRQSVSDIIHNFSTPVLKTDMSTMQQPGGAAILSTRLQIYNMSRDNQGIMALDKETEDFGIVSAQIGGLDKLQSQAQEQLASITSIPLVKYFGITPSGLNASSDGEVRVFYDTIHSAQERTGRPAVRKLLDIVQLGLFGEIDPNIEFKWNPLWSLDEKDLATVRETNARTDSTYIDKGVLDPAEVRTQIAGEEESRYSSIDVENVPDLHEEEAMGLGVSGRDPLEKVESEQIEKGPV